MPDEVREATKDRAEPSICPGWCIHKDAGLGYHRHSRMSDDERHEWGLNDTPESRLYR